MNKFLDEAEEVQFSEPILAQKGVRVGVTFAEGVVWTIKDKEKWSDAQRETMQSMIGQEFKALKLSLTISDDSVQTEHSNAKPRLTIEDQFNIQKYPYPDKNDGSLKWLGRQKLYQLEEALGFDPTFKAGGEIVEAHITKSGRKVAPKVDGVTRVLNPDFFDAFFDGDGNPKTDNWVGKALYADVTLEKNEQFGDRNAIARYVKGPEV